MTENDHDDHNGFSPDLDSLPEKPRPPRSARPVMLLARLAGVLAVTFSVIAVIVLHSTASPRLAGDVVTPTRTTSPTSSARPAGPHLKLSRPVKSAGLARGQARKRGGHAHHRRPGGVRPTGAVTSTPATRNPVASTAVISGEVTCMSGHSIEGVWVQASGRSGFAPWQGVRVPGKAFGSTSRWWWKLPHGDSYSLHVGCGGTQANWGVAGHTKAVSGTRHSFDCVDIKSKPGFGRCFET